MSTSSVILAFCALGAWTYMVRPVESLPTWQAHLQSAALIALWWLANLAFRYISSHIAIGWN